MNHFLDKLKIFKFTENFSLNSLNVLKFRSSFSDHFKWIPLALLWIKGPQEPIHLLIIDHECRLRLILNFFSLCFQMVRWACTLFHLLTPWAPSRLLPQWIPCPRTLYKWAPLCPCSSPFSVFASWTLFSMQILPITMLVTIICMSTPLSAHLLFVQMVSENWQLLAYFWDCHTHSQTHTGDTNSQSP